MKKILKKALGVTALGLFAGLAGKAIYEASKPDVILQGRVYYTPYVSREENLFGPDEYTFYASVKINLANLENNELDRHCHGYGGNIDIISVALYAGHDDPQIQQGDNLTFRLNDGFIESDFTNGRRKYCVTGIPAGGELLKHSKSKTKEDLY